MTKQTVSLGYRSSNLVDVQHRFPDNALFASKSLSANVVSYSIVLSIIHAAGGGVITFTENLT